MTKADADALQAAARAALGRWRPVRSDQYLKFLTTEG